MCSLFCITLSINSCYFPKQKQPVGRCNADCFPGDGGSEFLICTKNYSVDQNKKNERDSVGHVARMGERRGEYWVLVGKSGKDTTCKT